MQLSIDLFADKIVIIQSFAKAVAPKSMLISTKNSI